MERKVTCCRLNRSPRVLHRTDTALTERFVLHFGEMGSRWGINRTVGQIYALLFLSDRPLNAEEIAEALGVSRSNVSMGLKELEAWRLVRKRHLPGDRRDYFEAPDDVWEILRTLAEERRKREVDPTLSMLRDVLMETPSRPRSVHAQDRMRRDARPDRAARRLGRRRPALDNHSSPSC